MPQYTTTNPLWVLSLQHFTAETYSEWVPLAGVIHRILSMLDNGQGLWKSTGIVWMPLLLNKNKRLSTGVPRMKIWTTASFLLQLRAFGPVLFTNLALYCLMLTTTSKVGFSPATQEFSTSYSASQEAWETGSSCIAVHFSYVGIVYLFYVALNKRV